MALYFDENYYLSNKLVQLQLNGETGYTSSSAVAKAITDAGMTPYEHYKLYGDKEGINPNQFFNQVEYLSSKANQLNAAKFLGKSDWNAVSTKAAINDAGLTVAEHYNMYGFLENTNPSNTFDTSMYLDAKLAQLHTLSGSDANGVAYSSYTKADLNKALQDSGLDPISHYMAYGRYEGLQYAEVPPAERVPVDPARPQDPILSADGKTIIVHLQGPIIAASIEKEDFTITLNGKVLTVDSVAPSGDAVNYDLVFTLSDSSRVPGLHSGEVNGLRVSYSPEGGPNMQLAYENGPVAPFTKLVTNESFCFNVLERVTTEIISTPSTDPSLPPVESTVATLNITIIPPVGYEQPASADQFVSIDLTSKAGVVNGGIYGIPTAPLLVDGAQVQRLDTRMVDTSVHLNIKAGVAGTDITTGDGADSILLNSGKDVVNFISLTTSQLSHMDQVEKFAAGTDTLHMGSAGSKLVEKVIFKGPLSLEGELTESTIQAVLNTTVMEKGSAYLLQNGKNYILVADADNNGKFEGAKDFAVALIGVTGLAGDILPGTALEGWLS